jgi:S-formylglutathione hydrolase FrmB
MAMQKEPGAVVVLPDDYNNSSDSFSVIYLLHGWSGSFRDWSNHIDLRPLADHYQIIIVCPDGDYAGWYLDSPLLPESQYESYIALEVVKFIDSNYNSIKTPEGRFICGLSMGGYGAISLLARHPDIFGAAGSMSGVMDLTVSTKKYRIALLIGDYESHPEIWTRFSCFTLVRNLAGQDRGILLDCGVEDFTIASNRQLHQQLLDLSIPHEYFERPGGHSWLYWTNALEYHLLFFQKWRQQHVQNRLKEWNQR